MSGYVQNNHLSTHLHEFPTTLPTSNICSHITLLPCFVVCAQDYDVSYDFLLGALVNERLPWSGPREPQRFGHWETARHAVFYPSIIDTQPDGSDDEASLLRAREIRLRHFVAYVSDSPHRCKCTSS